MFRAYYDLYRTHAALCKLLADVSPLDENIQDSNRVSATIN